jgi:1-deoxy-D-xylulose-5-phosphate reductoisomerase
VGLAARKNAQLLYQQAQSLKVRNLAISDETSGDAPPGCKVHRGAASAERLVRETPCDIVLAAMVGSAGLPATLAAVELGLDVALANKETLVAAGSLVVPAAKESGSRLLPVDSEHCGIWQCLQGSDGQPKKGEDERVASPLCPPCEVPESVARVILTASGGPFRTRTKEEIYHATPDQALNHPTWNMGPKVTIDSASLTNKSLEIIEAHWLFGLPASRIGVLIHPQSVVHALVEFGDGSVVAQLGPPDMRSPIQYALTFPSRPAGISKRLDLAALSRLDFFPPDSERFPALDLAYQVIERGGTAGTILNAANEAAVEAFLAGRIPFGRITELSAAALAAVGVSPVRSLADVLQADSEARRFVAGSESGDPITTRPRAGSRTG